MAIIAALAAVLMLIYAAYVYWNPPGARGGSPLGLVFGFAGTGVILFECLLSLRKRYPASPLGRVSVWLRAHLWLGLLSFLLILMHSGWRFGQGLAGLLMILFTVILVSGVLGVVLQNWLPRRLTELVKRETVFEQIPQVITALRLDADERAEFLTGDLGIGELRDETALRAGGRKYYFDPAQFKSAMDKVEAERQKRRASPQIDMEDASSATMKAHYLQEIRPYLRERPSRLGKELFRNPAAVTSYFHRLRTILPPVAHEVLFDLEQIVEERRQLAIQARLHFWLHGWLLVHVPLSMAFLVLILVHAVMSLYF
ncbi:MAG: hypothetical protein HYZ37_01525 [Candidatus Solibacter usitatus]|nr:hypothetical protein [Candidatus Solibacter usitatus]